MFKFVVSIITFLTCLAAVATSPTSALQARAQAGPTGFNMCVMFDLVFKLIHLFFLSTSLGINGSGCPPGSAIYTRAVSSYFTQSPSHH